VAYLDCSATQSNSLAARGEHGPHAYYVRTVAFAWGVSQSTGLLSAPTLTGRSDGSTLDFVIMRTNPPTGSSQPLALRSGPRILARPVFIPAQRLLG
jgi:hypothetical protein